MQITEKYEPAQFENHWYAQWLQHKLFRSEPNHKEAYTIVIPPPNVTGMLHMGHMLNNTIQDVMIRRARMMGYNACWVPGTDHASIATEAKVVAMLKEKGINKEDLSREEFLEYAWEWKEKYGGIILNQLQKLGCSCDWDRTRFTMEDDLYEAVIQVFVDLYNKGLIYKGMRMVNWDPQGKTALSDEEVLHKEVDSNLYYVRYQIDGSMEYIQIATTRPETILGDTAICVHPEDPRYAHLKGKNAIVPIAGRSIPIIFDDYVDIEYGTGALKVTPAHDVNDYNLGVKHKLATLDIFNDDGTIHQIAGHYVGMDRFAVRKKIVADLGATGDLVKTEPIRNKVGFSERTNAMIEPRISQQWFVNMVDYLKQNPKVIESVEKDEIAFHPSKFKNIYRHWMENIKDWCISRQLLWGQQIPAYYLPDGRFVVAANRVSALAEAKKLDPSISDSDLKQDEDVLDTWFSSWLWPISVFDGIRYPDNEEIKYYYPTSLLVTAPDIIFFWVARMIMAGYEYRQVKPFSDVYFTGIVRDKLGRKMSKQLGNSPDPIDLMETYGTDGVRMGLLMAAPAGNDLLFDESLCEQGRNFANKIWNAHRLISGWAAGENDDSFYTSTAPDIHRWMNQRIADDVKLVNDHFDKFRVSDAMLVIYKLIWGDFCSWYLEWMKPAFGMPIPKRDLEAVTEVFDRLLRLLHPFMPYVTEHLWQSLQSSSGMAFINQQSWPQETSAGRTALEMERCMQLVTMVRSMRNAKGISPKVPVRLTVSTPDQMVYTAFYSAATKLANIESLVFAKTGEGNKELLNTDEVYLYFEGFKESEKNLDEIKSEIRRLKGFLIGIEKKLTNQKFMENAAADVIARERQKQADALQKIESLEKDLAN